MHHAHAEDGTARWRGWENAEHYRWFLDTHDIYDWLNAHLVRFAGLGNSRRVLDLGCGTGATTRRALGAVPPDAEVVGVDASPEMVAVADSDTLDPRARFVVAPAGDVGDTLRGRFDGAVSNAAFWQFPQQEAVWAALGQLLAPGSPFAFNVPAEREAGSGPSHGFQVALARALEARAGRPFHPTATRFDADRTAAHAAEAGLVEEERSVRRWRGPQRALIELMGIPAMQHPIACGLSPDAVDAAVAEAASRVDPDAEVAVDWVFLRYRRATSGPAEADASGTVRAHHPLPDPP